MMVKAGFIVLQQGGSSGEVYVHMFDTTDQVTAFRESCDEAAYQTSEPIDLPEGFPSEVFDLLEKVAQAAVNL